MQRNNLRILRPKIHEQLVELLMDDITKGRYAVGEQLPAERELMQTYGVGRPAVREAIAKLALMGIVDITPGIRARVRQPTLTRLLHEMDAFIKMFLLMPQGTEHLQEVRLLFESVLVRQAALRCTDEQLRELEASVERSSRLLDDIPMFVKEDLYFHSLFTEFAANPLLVGLNNVLGTWLREQRTGTLETPGQSRKAFESHRAIFEAVAARNPDAAEKALREHLGQVSELWLKNSASRSSGTANEDAAGASPLSRATGSQKEQG